MATFSAEPGTRDYLESLVARGYAEINARDYHGSTRLLSASVALADAYSAAHVSPATFATSHQRFAITIVGSGIRRGGDSSSISSSKTVLMPFPQLNEKPPADRVKREESAQTDRMRDVKTAFSAQLMTHNIQVSRSHARRWG